MDSALFSFNTKLPVRLIPALILDQRFHEEHIGYVVELNGKHSDWIPVVGAHDVVVWAEKRRGADIVIPECLAKLQSVQQKLAEAERALSQAKREAERAQWELDENRRIVQESLKHLSVVGQGAAS